MTRLPSTAGDVRHAIETGRWCMSCQIEFVQAHGRRTVCRYCFHHGETNFPLATHEEVAVFEAKKHARKKRGSA